MFRTLCIAAALAGAAVAATPAAADVVVRFGGPRPVYRAPVYVSPPPVVYVAPPVYVAPRAVYRAPVYVAPCRMVREKVVVRRPGRDIVKYRTIRRC